MSDNFRGVTFAEQGVTPADDAIVRRALLPDCILSGCRLSYSGSTLTMTSGHIIACGRLFRHIASQNWAIVDATSGYARIVLTIDLTKTSTETAFNQIEAAVEYAAAKNGFASLEQSDINVAGTIYQIVLCVVSLGAGGITGIVSSLATGFIRKFKVTVPTTGWNVWEDSSGQKFGYIDIPVPGILSTDDPDFDYDASVNTSSTIIYRQRQWALTIYKVQTSDGQIRVFATSAPTEEIPIKLKAVR